MELLTEFAGLPLRWRGVGKVGDACEWDLVADGGDYRVASLRWAGEHKALGRVADGPIGIERIDGDRVNTKGPHDHESTFWRVAGSSNGWLVVPWTGREAWWGELPEAETWRRRVWAWGIEDGAPLAQVVHESNPLGPIVHGRSVEVEELRQMTAGVEYDSRAALMPELGVMLTLGWFLRLESAKGSREF